MSSSAQNTNSAWSSSLNRKSPNLQVCVNLADQIGKSEGKSVGKPQYPTQSHQTLYSDLSYLKSKKEPLEFLEETGTATQGRQF